MHRGPNHSPFKETQPPAKPSSSEPPSSRYGAAVVWVLWMVFLTVLLLSVTNHYHIFSPMTRLSSLGVVSFKSFKALPRSRPSPQPGVKGAGGRVAAVQACLFAVPACCHSCHLVIIAPSSLPLIGWLASWGWPCFSARRRGRRGPPLRQSIVSLMRQVQSGIPPLALYAAIDIW